METSGAYSSTPADLTLHAPRVMGYASIGRIAARYALEPAAVEDFLLEFGRKGWVNHASFGTTSGWFLTEAGRAEDECRMARELDRAQARPAVKDVYRRFLPLNGRLGRACTDWQIRPVRGDTMAVNDHSDWAWDERVVKTLAWLSGELRDLEVPLTRSLARFDGYSARFALALHNVENGRRRWVAAPDVDSCHTVWIQFHEDLIATLGVVRGAEEAGPDRHPR